MLMRSCETRNKTTGIFRITNTNSQGTIIMVIISCCEKNAIVGLKFDSTLLRKAIVGSSKIIVSYNNY